MSTSQFQLYNGALRILKQEQLKSLSENVEARLYLDGVWSDGAIRYCLEQAQWYFAIRTAKFDADPSLAVSFGYANAFQKPSDWIRTSALCIDDRFQVPLTQVRDEAGFWFADITPLYVAFVSDDPDYGANFGLWPESFTQYVQAYLADEIAPKLTTSENDMKRVFEVRKKRLKEARTKAAMNESAMFPATGAWVRARYGQSGGWLDRGNRNSLIG